MRRARNLGRVDITIRNVTFGAPDSIDKVMSAQSEPLPGRYRNVLRHVRRRVASAEDAAVAAGLGAFNGLSDTQHPQVGAGVLDPQTAAFIQKWGCGIEADPSGAGTVPTPCILETARLLGRLPSYGNVYVLTNTAGNLCTYDRDGGSCDPPLSHSHPVTIGEDNTTGSNPVSYGLAMDGVTSVSFQAAGQQVTVPVKDNLWYYAGENSALDYLTVHFSDGSTELLHHGLPAS